MLAGSSWSRSDDAEESYRRAIVVAGARRAKSLEVRAVTSPARLWRHQGRHEEARRALSETERWFTEGLDTPDLSEARALLNALTTK